MKKLTSFLIIAAIAGFIASCKPKEKCPAYGKYQPKKAKSINS